MNSYDKKVSLQHFYEIKSVQFKHSFPYVWHSANKENCEKKGLANTFFPLKYLLLWFIVQFFLEIPKMYLLNLIF